MLGTAGRSGAVVLGPPSPSSTVETVRLTVHERNRSSLYRLVMGKKVMNNFGWERPTELSLCSLRAFSSHLHGHTHFITVLTEYTCISFIVSRERDRIYLKQIKSSCLFSKMWSTPHWNSAKRCASIEEPSGKTAWAAEQRWSLLLLECVSYNTAVYLSVQ